MPLTAKEKLYVNELLSTGMTDPSKLASGLSQFRLARQADKEEAFSQLTSDFDKQKSAFQTEVTPTFGLTEKQEESPSQFAVGKLRGEGPIAGALEGLGEGIEKAKELVGTRKGFIEEMPTETFGQKFKKGQAQVENVLQSGLDFGFRPGLGLFAGAAKELADPTIEDITESANAFIDERIEPEYKEEIKQVFTQYAQDVSDAWKRIPPQNQERLRSAGLVGEVTTLKGGTPLVKEAAEEAIEQTGKTFIKGTEILGEGAQAVGRQVDDVFETLRGFSPKLDDALQTPKLRAQLKGLNTWQDIKNTIVGIDKNLVPVLENVDARLAQEFLDVAKRFDADVTEITPHDFSVQKMQEGFTVLEKQIKDEGSLIGQARQKIATVKTGPEDVQEVIDSMLPVLKSKGYEVVDGKLNPLKGREPQLSPAEVTEVNAMLDGLKRAKGDPSHQRLLDNRINFDKNIRHKKRTGEISDGLDILSQKARGKLREILERQVGKSGATHVEAFAELKNVMDEIAGATSKGDNITKFMNRLLSDRGGGNKEIAAMFKEATGVDPMELAALQELSTKTIKSENALSLLTQATVGSVKTKGIFAKVDAIAGALVDITKDAVLPLDKQILSVIKNKKTRDALIKKLEAL